MAALFGADDHVAKRTSKRIDWSRPLPAFAVGAPHRRAGRLAARPRGRRLLAIKAEGEVTRALMQARCDRGAEIALRSASSAARPRRSARSTSTGTARASRAACAASEIPLLGGSSASPRPSRSSTRRAARRGATASRERRSGRWFDPALVDALDAIRDDRAFWRSLSRPRAAAAGSRRSGCWPPTTSELDRIADAFAGVVDAKSPWTYRHSDRTCVIATEHRARARLRRRDARATCAARRCCTTSASSRSPTGSSTSPRG